MTRRYRPLRHVEMGNVEVIGYLVAFRSHSIAKRRVPELISVLGSHKPGGRLPLLSTRPAVTPATVNRAATNFAAW